ncbi:MAG: hypothetical protein M1840_002035, partial [Geoglossum simile]
EDMDNINEFLSQAQGSDLEARRISGTTILNSIKNVADVVSLAGTVGQATGILPSKRSLQEDMDNINEFLSQAQGSDLEARRISGTSILNSIKNVADVVSLAGTVGQATGILPSKRSLQEDMDNINEFLSQAQGGDLEARRISGTSILNSIKNVADVVSIAGTVGQATGILPREQYTAGTSMDEGYARFEPFAPGSPSGPAVELKYARTVGQATGILPRDDFTAGSSLNEGFAEFKPFAPGSPGIPAVEQEGSPSGQAVELKYARTVGQDTGILPRILFSGLPKIPGAGKPESVPRLGPGIAIPQIAPSLRGPAIGLNNADQNQKRSVQDEIKELLGALGTRNE